VGLVEIIGLIILAVVGYACLKTWIFSSEEEKCFRRIWSMNKLGNFAERDTTYQRLFRKFDINFSGNVSNKSLILLIGAAHNFDATKNRNNLGVHVGPFVESEVGRQMKLAGKGDQFDELQANMQSAGENFINNIAKQIEK